MEERFFVLPFRYNALRNKGGGKKMGEIIVILGLALYVPMSLIFMFRGRDR